MRSPKQAEAIRALRGVIPLRVHGIALNEYVLMPGSFPSNSWEIILAGGVHRDRPIVPLIDGGVVLACLWADLVMEDVIRSPRIYK